MLTFPQRVIYGAPEIFIGLSFVSINSWLLFFFINVAGLSPVWAGVAFLLGRFTDAVLDPVVGRWSDRVRSRRGRITFLRWGLVPAIATYIALWWLPTLADGPVLTFVLAAGTFAVHSFFFTLIAIPRHALMPDLVPDYDARTRQVSINMIFIFISVLAAIALTPAFVSGLSGASDLTTTGPEPWIWTATIFSLVGLVFFVPFLFAIPDPKGGEEAVPERFLPAVRSLFRVPGYGRIVAIFLTIMMATTMVQAMTPFYLESYLGVLGEAQTPFLLFIFVLSILLFPVWGFVGTKLGKPAALILGAVIYGVFLVILWNLPREGGVPWLWIGCAFAGTGIAALNLFPWAMLPDAVDLDAARQGHAREGLVYSVFAFAQKVAGSLGIFAGSIMLELIGYQRGQVEQTPETLQGVVWTAAPIPLAILVVTVLLCLRFPVTKQDQVAARAAREDTARGATA